MLILKINKSEIKFLIKIYAYPGKKKMHFDFGVLEMHLKNA
jgi:hypothetical protein